MFRKLLLAAVAASTLALGADRANALGGNLRSPQIAIPVTGEQGEQDATASAINKVFQSHQKEFSGGHFINAHTVLYYRGGTKTINSLLAGLSKIEGAVVRVRFAKSAGSVIQPFPGPQPPSEDTDVEIDHNAWADAQAIHITIYLGSDRVNLDELELPALRGSADRR